MIVDFGVRTGTGTGIRTGISLGHLHHGPRSGSGNTSIVESARRLTMSPQLSHVIGLAPAIFVFAIGVSVFVVV